MPELLFSIVPNTPENAFKSAPKTPSPLNDITNQFTPRTTESGDNKLTPEMQDLIGAPCKNHHSPEVSTKPAKLSRRQLKFEDGISLQSIGNSSNEIKNVEVFENNPFCERKENNFVPLMPQRSRDNSADSGGGGRGGINNSKKFFEKQKTLPAATENMQENNCHVTPQKKNMPHLFGSNVTLDSPDPMSKFNSNNQTSSGLQQVAKKNTRMSVLLQNCKNAVVDAQEPVYSTSVPRLDIKGVESLTSIRKEASKFVSTEDHEHQFGKHGVTVSPDAITEDIYNFDARRDQPTYKLNKAAVESCKYPMSKDNFSVEIESVPALQKLSDEEEFQLTARVHSVRHKSVRIVEKQMTRRSLSPSLNTLERQLQQSATTGTGSPHIMPTSRSLDTLHPHTPNPMEEGQYIVLKPTPPPSSGGGGPRSSFNRKSPQPPSTSPKMSQSSSQNSLATPPGNNKENIEANIRQSRGRRYMNPVSPVVEETKEDLSSPSSHFPTDPSPHSSSNQIRQRPMPTRPTVNANRRRPQPSTPPSHPTTVQVEYCIKSPDRTRGKPTNQQQHIHSNVHSPAHAADIPHPSPKRKKGDQRTVTVSGFSKQFLVSLITAASKKRRRRNKHQPAFAVKLEPIPEDDCLILSFPSWITKACHINISPHVQLGPVQPLVYKEKPLVAEKSPERVIAEEEYREWLKSQILITQEDEEHNYEHFTPLDSLMLAIQSQDNDRFKNLINGNKNVIFARDQNGNTALIAATLFGWKRGIKNLIKRGADLDAQNRFGNTSLHYASAFEEHHEIRRYLLRKNASATIRNERGICSCDTIS